MEANAPARGYLGAVFGKLNVARDGATAEAVVLEAERHGGVSGAGGVSTVTYDLKLRARFDDGTGVEFSQHIGNMFKGAGAGFSVGDVVPVRFDPKDHSRIEVDMNAIRERQAADQATLKEMAADKAARIDRRLAEGKPAPMKGSEALKAMMDLNSRLSSGAITQQQFEAEKAALQERQSLY